MRNKPTAAFAAVALVAVAWTAAGAGATAETIDRHFHESFDVSPGAVLQLEHGDGDVVVIPWDKDVLDVEVRYYAEIRRVGIGSNPEFDVRFERDGNRIRVVGRETGSFNLGFVSSRQHEHLYKIQAPAYLTLDLRGEDGDVTIDDWLGEISLRLEDGDVEARNLAVPAARFELEDGDLTLEGFQGELAVELEDGDLVLRDCRSAQAEIRVEDGSVAMDRCEGSFEIAAEDGDLDLQRLRAARLRLHTADGDATIGLLGSDDLDLEARSTDGNLALEVERGFSAAFSIETDDGRVRIDAASAVDVERGKHRVTGRLGGGGGKIRLTTSDGNVTLTES